MRYALQTHRVVGRQWRSPARYQSYNVFAVERRCYSTYQERLPHITLYATLDPYRQSFRAERDHISRKLDAGADGFFTQPFFDRRLLEIYAELLENEVVFWGITPVIRSGTRGYWETTNNAVFPRGFEPTMEWNRAFARDTLRLIDGMNSNAYLMPIRVDLAAYLDGLR